MFFNLHKSFLQIFICPTTQVNKKFAYLVSFFLALVIAFWIYVSLISIFSLFYAKNSNYQFDDLNMNMINIINQNKVNIKPSKSAFIIGIDGAGTLPQIVETPGIHKVINNGIYSYEGETVSPTMSAECWTSLLYGVYPEQHGISTFKRNHRLTINDPYPSIFRALHEYNASAIMASFCNWDFINDVIVEDGIGVMKFTDAKEKNLLYLFKTFMKNYSPSLVFIQLDETDTAGHKYGFFTDGHKNQLIKTDHIVSQIIDIIEQYDNNSLIVMQADHGGGGEYLHSHGTDNPKDKLIFWAARGTGIDKMKKITSVSTVDTSYFVAHYLGIPIPRSWKGTIPSLSKINL